MQYTKSKQFLLHVSLVST